MHFTGEDIFNLDKLYFPINVNGVHWVLGVVSVTDKTICIYDSMNGGDLRHWLETIWSYLRDEHEAKRSKPLNRKEWSLLHQPTDTPIQNNGKSLEC